MTLATERLRLGREPTTIVEIVADVCEHTFGSAPCTASAAAGGECYNTRQTCQDPANFSATTTSIYFTESMDGFPVGMYPAIKGKVNNSPTILSPEKGLGQRSSVSITLSDFLPDDITHDPYFDTRLYDINNGSWWGKWLARNCKSYYGRTLKVHVGYLTSPFAWGNFQTFEYVIDRIDGVQDNGTIKITGKDPLKRIDDVFIPEPNKGTVVYDASATSTNVLIRGDTYDASGYVRIDSEIIYYSTNTASGDHWVLSGLQRGARGTEAKEHKKGAAVQQCTVWDNLNPVVVLKDLLDQCGLDSTYRDTTSFDYVEDVWASGSETRTIISKPQKATKSIQDLCYHFLMYIWWDDRAGKIKVEPLAPKPATYVKTSITAATEILEDTCDIKSDFTKQITRAFVAFNPINAVELSDVNDYQEVQGTIDANAEDPSFFDVIKSTIIKSEWIGSPGAAFQMATRLVIKYSEGEQRFKFKTDAALSGVWLGDVVSLESPNLQDVDGSNLVTDVQIIRAKEDGNEIEFEGVSVKFDVVFAEYTENAQAVYDSSSAADQIQYGFYADDSGFLGAANDAAKEYV